MGKETRTVIIACLWILVSIFFLDVTVSKVFDLRAIGQPVSFLRYAKVAFWVVIPVFWISSLIRGWRSRVNEVID